MSVTLNFYIIVLLYLIGCFIFLLLSYIVIQCRKKRVIIEPLPENYSIAYPVPIIELPVVPHNLEHLLINENIEN